MPNHKRSDLAGKQQPFETALDQDPRDPASLPATDMENSLLGCEVIEPNRSVLSFGPSPKPFQFNPALNKIDIRCPWPNGILDRNSI